jgi:hypothetical protein
MTKKFLEFHKEFGFSLEKMWDIYTFFLNNFFVKKL